MNLDLPGSLRDAIAKEVEAVAFVDLAEAAGRLRDGYRSEQVDQTPALDSPMTALAYAAYRMPGTYAAVRAVFARAIEAIPALRCRRITDVGGGTGAGAWAALETWPDVETITIQDTSASVTDLGRRLAEARPTGGASFLWQAGLPALEADLAMAAYLLGELGDTERGRLLERLLGHADTVVIVEPGTTAGYRRILEARTAMLSQGMRIAAPCPHEQDCPLTGSDWCHFAARFNRSSTLRRLKEAEHGHDDEKFSYIIGTRLTVAPASGRIIRHPQTRRGLVTLQLCDGDGSTHPVTITRRHGTTYRTARDARWGDGWPDLGGGSPT